MTEELNSLFNNAYLSLENKRKAVEAILTIIKSKPIWEKEITVESKEYLLKEYLLTAKECKDNLMRNIAEFYAKECEQSSQTNHKYHICQWIKYLHNFSI